MVQLSQFWQSASTSIHRSCMARLQCAAVLLAGKLISWPFLDACWKCVCHCKFPWPALAGH